MLKLGVVVVVSMSLISCAKRGDAVRFQMQPTSPEVCSNTLIIRARQMGYVETMADRSNGFFSVAARTSLGGLPYTGATSRNLKRAREASQVHFNVQCQNGAVTAIAVGVDGPIDEGDKMNKKLRKELDRFGVGLMSGSTFAVLEPAPAPVTADGSPCVAEQLPEWQGASAAKKKQLLDMCATPVAPPPPPTPAPEP
ncbi:MAG: hypothetical protein ACO1OB_27200 [Archangium sp.]